MKVCGQLHKQGTGTHVILNLDLTSKKKLLCASSCKLYRTLQKLSTCRYLKFGVIKRQKSNICVGVSWYWCQTGTILVWGQRVGVLTGNLSYPLSLVSQPGPVQSRGAYNSWGNNSRAVPEGASLVKWSGVKAEQIDIIYALALHHWEAVVCFTWLADVLNILENGNRFKV